MTAEDERGLWSIVFGIHSQLDRKNLPNSLLTGSDVPLDLYTGKTRLRTSFGAHDVELKSCFRCNVQAFTSIIREDKGNSLCGMFSPPARACWHFLVTNVRNHKIECVGKKKLLTKLQNFQVKDKFFDGTVELEILPLFTLLGQYSKPLTSWCLESPV